MERTLEPLLVSSIRSAKVEKGEGFVGGVYHALINLSPIKTAREFQHGVQSTLSVEA